MTDKAHCVCGLSLDMLDRIRQSEHSGGRYISASGRLYCSVYCAEQHDDATGSWVIDPCAQQVL